MKTEKLVQWAEIISSLVVVLTLIFLIHEVRENTKAVGRQFDLDRAQALNAPFFEAPELASVLAKIKEVDGPDPLPAIFMERYGLSHQEAILWERHLWLTWIGIEADYYRSGGSEDVAKWVRNLIQFQDQRLFWEDMAPSVGPEFRAFVESMAMESGT